MVSALPRHARGRSTAAKLGLLALCLLPALACSGGGEEAAKTVGTWTYLPRHEPLAWRDMASYVWTGSELFVWGGYSAKCDHGPPGDSQSVACADGALLDPTTGTWRETSRVGSPSPRDSSLAVWTGKEVFVWGGGDLTDGALFDPEVNAWRPIAPAPATFVGRRAATAVWAGTQVVVWGGVRQDAGAAVPMNLGDGARFDPVANAWSPMSLSGAPSARSRHSAVWTGTEMIVWGGVTDTELSADGASFDPVRDVWTPISSTGAPAARGDHAAVWTGKEMLVLAGSEPRTGGRYDPELRKWTTFTIPAPVGFHAAWVAAWTGTKAVIWGWLPPGGWGGLYDPAAGAWELMVPSPESFEERLPSAIYWTGSNVLVWGGISWDGTAQSYDDGALFTP